MWRNGALSELADLSEILRYLAVKMNWKWEDVEKVRVAKLAEKGGFDKNIILLDAS